MSTPKSCAAQKLQSVGPVACRACDLYELCGVLDAVRDRLPTASLKVVPTGTTLYRAGAQAERVYAIRKGTFKAVRTGPEGKQRVIGIRVPGEVLGIEAFGFGRYAEEVVALTPAICCAIPASAFAEHHRARISGLSSATLRLLGRASAPRGDFCRGTGDR